MRIALAVDGSPVSGRAARYVARLASQMSEPPSVALLNVDLPLLNQVAIKLGAEAVRKYHAENARSATRTARAALHRAGIVIDDRTLIGDPAGTIVKFCAKDKCDLLVMGSHGRNAVKSLFLGSVAIKVLSRSTVPVLVVR